MLTEKTLAYAETTVIENIAAGDHRILIGRIDGAGVVGGRPLLYQRRTYSVWSPETSLPVGHG